MTEMLRIIYLFIFYYNFFFVRQDTKVVVSMEYGKI